VSMYHLSKDGKITKVGIGVWGKWMDEMIKNGRHVVKQTTVNVPNGDIVNISTVFTGHDLPGRKPPLVFETMVFGGEFDGLQDRTPSVEHAKIAHKLAVSKVYSSCHFGQDVIDAPRKERLLRMIDK